ncbi:hypothetical protein [Frigoriglobus tundricola]|uniref:Uncharacterized protein n=1 Tax=Frigoriglobus tundricola TaxID=2774151 RepID=A0A6M5YMU3_9BACT|nr:hypothetical protein [Frigoriglobus tundricola]QJW95275.1 hypothetical protein FTUN_2817 [Frigoriglobus tundricola]
MATELVKRFGVPIAVGTRREADVVWHNRIAAVGSSQGQMYVSAWYEVEIVDRAGALPAGVIREYSVPGDLPRLAKKRLKPRCRARVCGSGGEANRLVHYIVIVDGQPAPRKGSF